MKKKRDVKFIVTLSLIWGLTAIFCLVMFLYTNAELKRNVTNVQSTQISDFDYVDKGLTTVDFTLPKEMFMGQTPNTTLTDEQKSDGYISATLNADGSVTYKIKKSSYNQIVKEAKSDTIKTINDVVKSGDYPSIKKVTYNNDLSKITLTVDKSAYNGSMDSLACWSIEFSVGFFNILIDSDKDCIISIVDASTNEVFDTYPKN